jgi:EAL domain-containing protein (putative c-di-GMP-specific phosphodiesterase class I)
VADRIQQELKSPFDINGHEVFASVSIGIVLSSTSCERAEHMLRDADLAMYKAKAQGRARFELFDTSMHNRAVSLLRLETDLRRSVMRKEFIIHYQPVILLESGLVSGFEALIRWQHPQRGIVYPMEFISVAEETGLINLLSQLVLSEACRQLRVWQERYPAHPALTISVNLSGKEFSRPDLVKDIDQIIKDYGVDPHGLKLEITEGVIMENAETAAEMLRQLKALGVQLSVDDFGTGYSSLSYLHRFPLDTLKIDRSFVGRMDVDPDNSEIVRTIITLAHNLGLDVIAEGVETVEQIEQLRELGCEHGQGYYIGRPMTAEAAGALLEEIQQRAQFPRAGSAPLVLPLAQVCGA